MVLWFSKYTLPGTLLTLLQVRYIVFQVYPSPTSTPHLPLCAICPGQFASPLCCFIWLLPAAMYRGRGCTFQTVTLLHYLAPSSRRLVLSLAGCCRVTLFASCSHFLFLSFLLHCFLLPQPEGLPPAKSSNSAIHPQHSFLLQVTQLFKDTQCFI
jgi:hypothetical protein